MYMEKAKFALAAIFLMFFAAACGDDSSSSSNNNQPSVTISIVSAATAYFGESTRIPVTTTPNTDFTVSVNPSGLGCVKDDNAVICTPEATGEYDVTVAATADRTKTATVKVNVPELEIRFGAEEDEELVFYADENENEEITFNAAGDWTAAVTDDAGNAPSWVELSVVSDIFINSSIDETLSLYDSGSTVSGSKGNTTIMVTLQPNHSGADRTATITITVNSEAIEITIVQKSVKEDGTSMDPPCQTCTVTFDSNGGGSVSPLTGPSGGSITLPAARRSGYTFHGWYPNQKLNPAARMSAGDSYTVTANVTLYAKWIRFTTIDHPELGSSFWDINNQGHMVVTTMGFGPSGVFSRSFLYDGENVTNIVYPESNDYTSVGGINNSGQIAGAFRDSEGKLHGFLYSGGSYTKMEDHPDADSLEILGINDSANIAGCFWDSNGGCNVFLYNTATKSYTVIDSPPGASGIVMPYGINNSDQIVGIFTDSNNNVHGFLYNTATKSYTVIDHPDAVAGNMFGGGTVLHGINNSGQIAGSFVDSRGNRHGFIFADNRFFEFDHPDAAAGANGTDVWGINDSGQVLGRVYNGQRVNGFLLEGLLTAQ